MKFLNSKIFGERKTQPTNVRGFFFLFKRFLQLRNIEAQNWLQVLVTQKLDEPKKNFKSPLNTMSLMIYKDNHRDHVINKRRSGF